MSDIKEEDVYFMLDRILDPFNAIPMLEGETEYEFLERFDDRVNVAKFISYQEVIACLISFSYHLCG